MSLHLSLQEWVASLLFLYILRDAAGLIVSYPRQEFPYRPLGRLDDPAFNASGVTLIFTPATSATRAIMAKVASSSSLRGVIIEEVENEAKMEEKGLSEEETIGVVFKDDFSYTLRFQIGSTVFPDEGLEHIETCWDFSAKHCKVPLYWYGGFLSVQSSIDAAVIEVMKVLKEKKKLKILMRAMGLQDIAFWLSWSLLYTVYVSITASLLTWVTLSEVFNHNSFLEVYFFYFFYGMACIHFTFLLSSLLKQPNISSFVGFLLHILFGALGFLTLFEKLPRALEWTLNIFSPFAFTAGLATMVKLEKYGPAFSPELYPFYNLYLVLSLDSVLYFLLAIYFDKVLPGKYGVPHPPTFFLRPSYWLGGSSGYVGVRAGSSHDPVLGGDTEPMPAGFDGKEAIRLNNIKKIFKNNNKSTEALKGLSLNIYEGQITALLGHSGSGKTALLNVLSGFSKPSAGSAMIYNYNASEMWNMEGIQEKVGICPQSNLHFEALTVKENLRIFAHIKGIQWKEVDEEVQKVLVMMDLTDVQNVCAEALSGGQKRKLSLGIAILGNPQVLLLDEPTAGLDPCSRHHVWSLLRERRAGRVTLVATQSMEEADTQADRKAFLSCGRLQSVGSSLYLKRKWGIGYHLRMHINDLCDPELVSSMVRQYIPDAVLKGQKRDELCFRLPLENTDSFPDLFSHLESSLVPGVVNYEVTRTTLEDVFLKLQGEEAIDPEGEGDLEERDQNLPWFSKQGMLAMSGMMLWRQQVCAVLRIRLLRLKHEGKFLRGMSTNLLIFNDTGSEIEDFIAALKTQNITPEITPEKNITSLPNYNGAIKISLEGKSRQFTVMCSPEPINCFPVLVNILSNTFLRLSNSTARFRVWSQLFYSGENSELKNYIFFGLFTYLLVLTAGLPPLFAMSSVEDYKVRSLRSECNAKCLESTSGQALAQVPRAAVAAPGSLAVSKASLDRLQARSQLRLAGLFPSAYWCGQALVDIPFFWSLICLMCGILMLFTRIFPLETRAVLTLLICIFGYGISLVLFVYLMAFKFRTGRSNRYIWSLAFILVNYAAFMNSDHHEVLYYACMLIPMFPPVGWIMFSGLNFLMYHDYTIFETWNYIYMPVFAPYIHCVIFAFLLRCLEMRYGEAVPGFDPIFRMQRRREAPRQNKEQAGEEPPEVQAERERVRRALASLQPEEDLVVVNSLRKEYEVRTATSIFKKKKKLAVKNLSFGVKKGSREVLGLLGPNGAGKSTTLNMISGGVAVTAGEVLLGGRDEALGWCPQQDPLWPHLTVLQHLEAFAAIRGMREEDAALAISCIGRALDLLKHFKTPARSLSAGEARKLSFALSILGGPAVMLWDEPSVSLDPKGQRRMWRMVEASMKSKERAGVLCTQSLEEAAAMCDRVAILLAGRLRYIGSLEDLRSKFGTSYHLELKMTDAGRSDALHTEILNLFPHAARQERTSSMLTYKIPVADALPLSRSFSQLEAAKRNFKLEEYSLSLNTLHQEWILSLLFLPLVFVVSSSPFMMKAQLPEVPSAHLSYLDDPAFNASGVTVAFTPATATTRHIMNKVASSSLMTGIKLVELDDERAMEKTWISNRETIGVVFKDNFSYHLRFPTTHVVIPNEVIGYIDTCYNFSWSICESPRYWYKGFLSLQSSIDAAIIEMVANHSVWEEMESIAGVRMKSRSILFSISLEYSYFMMVIMMCFFPFMYFLSRNVTREKKQLKELMKTMGLHDIAFWLSWSLLYSLYVLIFSCLLTALVLRERFYASSFPAVSLLFFLYGLACIHLVFMLCSLLRTSKIVSCMGFFIIFIFGFLGLAVLIEDVPEPLKWFLGLMCSFAFNTAIAKIFDLEKYGIGFSFSNLMGEAHFLFSTYILLVFDSVLYMLLALYFDKILPGKYGIPDPPLFFLKASYWMRSRRRSSRDEPRATENPEELLGDDVEPVPPEFLGKEAIRLHNIKKAYKKKDEKTEALRGLSLNVYEGQITALLGHSGAGKTTLLNVLSGLSFPSAGSATIYNYKLSEMGDREEIRSMIGICPQFNPQFEVLTVKENLKTFAEIKGIKSKEVEREVQNILELLDISNIQDTQAEKLSGGQKRKLSIGIAMLGNPQTSAFLPTVLACISKTAQLLRRRRRTSDPTFLQVLFLDEPTAGLDPLSRHRVWSVLREQRAGRVVLFSTQLMEEADILADRKAFISHGRLKCVGSSLFLKKKWGICYHLRIHVSESCDLENVTSLVKGYIPNATFSGHTQYELRYKLPLENICSVASTAALSREQLAVDSVNYGVSMTTLEDVFLRLEGEAMADQEGEPVPGEEWGAAGSPEEARPGSLLLSDTGTSSLQGLALWRQQVSATARVHFLKLRSSVKNLRSILLLYVVFLLPLVLQVCMVAGWQSVSAWQLSPARYFLPLGRRSYLETTTLLVYNHTGTDVDDFIHVLQSQDIAVEIAKEENITEELEHNGAIVLFREGQSYRFTVLCHLEAINCFPVLVNVISNALLRSLNSTRHIQVWSHPFFSLVNPGYWDYIMSFYLIYMLLLLPGFPPHFAMGYTQDCKVGARAQLRVSGLFPSAYWCGQALVDIPLCWILLFSMLGLQFAMSNMISGNASVTLLLVTGMLGYGISLVLLIYVISFNSRKEWSCDLWSFILIVVCFISLFISRIINNLGTLTSLYTLSLLVPVYPLMGFAIHLVFDSHHCHHLSASCGGRQGKAVNVATSGFQPYIHSVVFILLLRFLELKYGKAVLRQDPIFRISPRKESSQQHPKELEEEDEDVRAEREAVRNAVVAPSQEEVLMTRGDGGGSLEQAPAFLGYCPQENPLWLDLTPQQHLRVYAAVKGLQQEDAAAAVHRKTIQDALKSKESGALLSTQYMEEAEAVCDRVAILVSGQLRCIGSIQYLKNKFGKGYLLEIKVKDAESTDALHAEILKIFPGAARQERCPSLLVYKIPMKDALPLSQSFSKLEEAKRSCSLEEYSFSLNTLTQAGRVEMFDLFLCISTLAQTSDGFMDSEPWGHWEESRQEKILCCFSVWVWAPHEEMLSSVHLSPISELIPSKLPTLEKDPQLQRLENVERSKVRDVSHSWRCQERRTGIKDQDLQPRFTLIGGKGSIRKSKKDRAENQLNFLLLCEFTAKRERIHPDSRTLSSWELAEAKG
ncbi:ATP-binding cassette sub-family A member 8-B [Lonchura striata]|uniref:ATP-binding cassette sub-family A member 8-B n=1 Tax=Lonchura striata TaxID=40157 RepID=A0A218UX83_9PASE|nr:ATP-binding cassette sub-family A member 8-B [Lonchura striata domestica]